MASNKLTVWDYRLLILRSNVRVLWLNICYGWTTRCQRYEAFQDGQAAVESAGHHPENTHQHPVLRREFNDGTVSARGYFAEEEREAYMQEMESTYAAIQRDEMRDVFHECRELGLVSSVGRILHN